MIRMFHIIKTPKDRIFGILIKIHSHTYFAPLSSPKPVHKKYSKNATYMMMKDGNKTLGIIKFNCMIPIEKDLLTYIDFNQIEDVKYKNWLQMQNRFVRKYTDKIIERANEMYNIITKEKDSFFISISCNFKLLEEKAREYKK